MTHTPYLPIYELTRGETVESIHDGAIAIVDAFGQLLAWFGDPQAVTFLRSSAKPFQALPFVEHGGPQFFGLTMEEVALMCASHSGTDTHTAVIRSIQAKAGFSESDLMCGVHPPFDAVTVEALRQSGEALSSNRHNCSGKHSGMLAYTSMKRKTGQPVPDDKNYIDFEHPIQKEIIQAFADMCGLEPNEVHMGVDGCSAPNFAIPLYNAALGFARLSDPENGGVQPEARRQACHTITQAMMAHPFMVGGPERFDTSLMQVTGNRIVSKRGAEAFQGIGLLPGVLAPDAPGIGIALKVADGDERKMALSAVVMEVLHQLHVLNDEQMAAMCAFGPTAKRYNWRKIVVGQAYPTFQLNWK